jgi:hypothetical protein
VTSRLTDDSTVIHKNVRLSSSIFFPNGRATWMARMPAKKALACMSYQGVFMLSSASKSTVDVVAVEERSGFGS